MDLKAHKILDRKTEDSLVLEDAHESQGMAKTYLPAISCKMTKSPADEKLASGPWVRAEDEECDEDSSSDDGLCRCPLWCGQAFEAGPLCPDCLQVRTRPSGPKNPQYVDDRKASDDGEAETASQECGSRSGDTKHQPDFPDVPKCIWGGCWSRPMSKMWAASEPQCILEARAAIFTLKHLCRSIGNFPRRHLILGDAMAVVLALTKGRSSLPVLLSICREWCAYSLAADIYGHLRWVP